jgi:RNA-binding protein
MDSLANAQICALIAQAQRLEARLKAGKKGLNLQFLAALDDALKYHALVKVKFDDFKEQKVEFVPQPAERLRTYQVRQKVASCPQDFAICERSQGVFFDWAFPNSRHASILQLLRLLGTVTVTKGLSRRQTRRVGEIGIDEEQSD